MRNVYSPMTYIRISVLNNDEVSIYSYYIAAICIVTYMIDRKKNGTVRINSFILILQSEIKFYQTEYITTIYSLYSFRYVRSRLDVRICVCNRILVPKNMDKSIADIFVIHLLIIIFRKLGQ